MISERENIYELPGLYYNGTVTITHLLTANSAWDAEASSTRTGEKCANNDREQKTYEYPALFFIGSNGNATDSNPVFWALRAFQPADQVLNEQYLDVYQRWLHIRSSDFVVTDTSLEAEFFGQYQYYASDETRLHRQTRVYWNTNITASSDSKSYTASATYVSSPPEISLDQRSFASPPPGTKPRTSQYITLSDVCYYDQELWNSHGSLPVSYIPPGNNYLWSTTPTLFLSQDATASISSIGGDTLSFTLNDTLSSSVAFVSEQQSNCLGSPTSPRVPFTSSFNLLHWRKHGDYTGQYLWNISANVGVSFQGRLVGQNSTTITGTKDGVPLFKEGYERRTKENTTTGTGKSGAGRAVESVPGALAALSLAFVALFLGLGW